MENVEVLHFSGNNLTNGASYALDYYTTPTLIRNCIRFHLRATMARSAQNGILNLNVTNWAPNVASNGSHVALARHLLSFLLVDEVDTWQHVAEREQWSDGRGVHHIPDTDKQLQRGVAAWSSDRQTASRNNQRSAEGHRTTTLWSLPQVGHILHIPYVHGYFVASFSYFNGTSFTYICSMFIILQCWFTDTNVCVTGFVEIWKTCRWVTRSKFKVIGLSSSLPVYKPLHNVERYVYVFELYSAGLSDGTLRRTLTLLESGVGWKCSLIMRSCFAVDWV